MAVRAIEPRSATQPTVGVLQALLVDLVALSLETKQAHWNLTGPLFQPLHELFDRFTDTYREWYDEVAERLRALGVPADGRPATVAATTKVGELPGGLVSDRDALQAVLAQIEGVAARLRERLPALGEDDPATQDLAIAIVRGLEKQAWMLRATAA
ncbi:MAG TPA: DNA starvation/stationary phase protection protein [Gemmatimonadales bacterium]|nr:DNA starvation/stationary phase protection protein [Gemmatimonadales bacterium]